MTGKPDLTEVLNALNAAASGYVAPDASDAADAMIGSLLDTQRLPVAQERPDLDVSEVLAFLYDAGKDEMAQQVHSLLNDRISLISALMVAQAGTAEVEAPPSAASVAQAVGFLSAAGREDLVTRVLRLLQENTGMFLALAGQPPVAAE